MSVKIYDTVYLGAAKPSSGGGSSDYNVLSNKPQINGVTLTGNKTSADLGIIIPKYLSVERLGEYIYKATFDSIPEYDPSLYLPVDGSCTSFVRDGKLYRNFDWKYDNTAEFLVVCKDFQGISSIVGMNDGSLDVKKVEQLPYHVVDGVNKDGIMVSTHILYNDWTYAGAGDKDQDIMLMPYYILNNLHDISNIDTVLASYVANIKIPDVLANAEYLLQFVVTDGTTTYCIMPPASATGSYVIQDITSNPKLTNFRWVSDATVVRADLQTRPTGVERWNEIATSDLEDLRFTKCYEAATRLSEFIGIDETTKDSTDAELTAIYDLAHAAYQTRTRDGNLWQTVHSVVFGSNGIEHLWCQENYSKDYIGEPETVVKNVITLTGESGTLTSAQIAQVQDDTTVLEIVCDGEVFRLSNKDSTLTYRTFMNTNCEASENVSFKVIYVQLNSEAVNYGAWTLEEVSAGGGASYTAGTGIDITGGVISVTDPVIKNIAPSSLGSLAIGGSLEGGLGGIIISSNWNPGTLDGSGSIVIGGGSASGEYAIQLGGVNPAYNQNSEPKTFCVGFTAEENYKLLDSDGTIPVDRMTNVISDSSTTATNQTWSASKLNTVLGDIETLINAL